MSHSIKYIGVMFIFIFIPYFYFCSLNFAIDPVQQNEDWYSKAQKALAQSELKAKWFSISINDFKINVDEKKGNLAILISKPANSPAYLFNVSNNDNLPQPYRFYIVDDKDRIIADWDHPLIVSNIRNAVMADWQKLEAGGIVGCDYQLNFSRLSLSADIYSIPDKLFLKVLYLDAGFSFPKDIPPKEMGMFEVKFKNSNPIAVSEAIAIPVEVNGWLVDKLKQSSPTTKPDKIK